MKLYARPLEYFKHDTAVDILYDQPTGGSHLHAQFAPSASHRWLHCPQSAQPLPTGRRESSTAAKEGTAAHLLLSWFFAHAAAGKKAAIPDRVHVEGETFSVDDFMVGACRKVAQFCKGATEVWSEREVVPFQKFADVCSGTSDVMMWFDGDRELRVLDFKFGRVSVAAKDNPQLLLYAMGAIRLTGKSPDRITVAIYQPRVSALVADTWTYTKAEFQAAIKPLLLALVHAQDKPKEAQAGAWCKWCNHHVGCETFAARFQELTSEPPIKDSMLDDISLMYPALKAWVEEADKRLRSHLQDGYELSGLKLVHGPGRRQWAVEKVSVIDRLGGILDDIDDAFTLLSIAQIEALVPKHKREVFKALVVRGSPSLQMVTIDDTRPAVGAATEFDNSADTEEFEE